MPRDETPLKSGKRPGAAGRGGAGRVDIAYFLDLTERAFLDAPPGALADEIAVQSAAGYSHLVVPLDRSFGGRLELPAWLRQALSAGQARLAGPELSGPVRAKLAIFPQPSRLLGLLGNHLAPPVKLSAERSLLLIDSQPVAPDGALAYGLSAVQESAWQVTGSRPEWAAVWPGLDAAVQAYSRSLKLLTGGWAPVVDPQRWAAAAPGPAGETPLAGRYAPPAPSRWPSDIRLFLSRYPLSRHVRLRLLGVPEPILCDLRRTPANWDVFANGTYPPERLLRSLDFFIHYPGTHLLDQPDHAILTALEAGCMALLPRQLEPLFGEAARYPSDGRDAIDIMVELHRDTAARQEQVSRGRDFLAGRHTPQKHLERLRDLIGAPEAAKSTPSRKTLRKAATPVLFVTSNGVGMGHLTRLLAIARRLPSGLTPIFATMSQAVAVVRAAGFHTEYLPFHTYIECDKADWDAWLEEELGRLLDLFGARALVYDGGSPHQGVIDAATQRRDVALVWCRRAMWQDPLWDEPLARAKFFDLVIEPGELAGAFDRGASVRQKDRVAAVDPILLLDEGELLPRDAACRALGLDPDRPAVLIQLGAGNHTSQQPFVDEIARRLGQPDGPQLVLAEWLMAERTLGVWPQLRRLRGFPNARYLRAFVCAISAAGYNSFHELTHYGVPTLFVPVELPFLDDQLGRARHAEREGYGLLHPAGELRRLPEALSQLLDPQCQQRLRAGCLARRRPNGAPEAAALIAGLLESTGQLVQKAAQGPRQIAPFADANTLEI